MRAPGVGQTHRRVGKTRARFDDWLLRMSRVKPSRADHTWTANEPSMRSMYASRNSNVTSSLLRERHQGQDDDSSFNREEGGRRTP